MLAMPTIWVDNRQDVKVIVVQDRLDGGIVAVVVD